MACFAPAAPLTYWLTDSLACTLWRLFKFEISRQTQQAIFREQQHLFCISHTWTISTFIAFPSTLRQYTLSSYDQMGIELFQYSLFGQDASRLVIFRREFFCLLFCSRHRQLLWFCWRIVTLISHSFSSATWAVFLHFQLKCSTHPTRHFFPTDKVVHEVKARIPDSNENLRKLR